MSKPPIFIKPPENEIEYITPVEGASMWRKCYEDSLHNLNAQKREARTKDIVIDTSREEAVVALLKKVYEEMQRAADAWYKENCAKDSQD